MQGLDPVMDGILQKMYEVTDNSNLHELQQEAKFNAATEEAPVLPVGLGHMAQADSLSSEVPVPGRAMTKTEKNSHIDNVMNDAYKRIDAADGVGNYWSGYNYEAKDQLRRETNKVRNAASVHRSVYGGDQHVHSTAVHHHVHHRPPTVVHHHHNTKTVITTTPTIEEHTIVQPPTKVTISQPAPKARVVEQPTELKFDPWTGDATIEKHPDKVVFDKQPQVVTYTKPTPEIHVTRTPGTKTVRHETSKPYTTVSATQTSNATKKATSTTNSQGGFVDNKIDMQKEEVHSIYEQLAGFKTFKKDEDIEANMA